MKNRILLVFVCFVLAVSVAVTGCSKNATGPSVANATLSGVVYADQNHTTPVPNVTITVYEVDTTATRTGAAVASAATNGSGVFSVSVPKNKSYEFVLTDGTSILHVYLPETTADKSGITLYFMSLVGASSMVTGGILIITNNSGFVTSADTLTVDGGANLNNSTSSPGIYGVLELLYIGLGNMAGVIDYEVTESAAPGTAHAIAYKGVTRNVRVSMLSSNEGTIAVFY